MKKLLVILSAFAVITASSLIGMGPIPQIYAICDIHSDFCNPFPDPEPEFKNQGQCVSDAAKTKDKVEKEACKQLY